jgi:YVTN family beta-propeller protein/autotransporter-associated beta strand protein
MIPQEHFKPMRVHNSSVFSSSDARSATSDWQAVRRLQQACGLFTAVVVAGLGVAATCEAQIEANAYISNNGSNTVSVINTETQALVGSAIPVGTQPFGSAATPDGRFVYVANVVSNTVSVISADTNLVSTTIPVGARPFGIAASSDAKFAYVSNSADNTVSVIDTATNTVVGSSISVGNRPFGIAVTPNGSAVYVANNLDDSVSVIDTATKTVATIKVGVGTAPQGVAITPDGQFVYVANLSNSPIISSNVVKISTATNTVVQTISLPSGAGTPSVTPDGKLVYVTNQADSSVTVISISTGNTDSVLSSILLEKTLPFGVSMTPNGQFAFVTYADESNASISVINTANPATITSIAVGMNPNSFGSFIGPNIIVAPGGPLVIANDAALTPLGFGTFVDFNGGTLQTSGSLITSRTISLLALGGTIDTNGFNSTLAGRIVNSGALTKIGTGTLTLSGDNSYSGGTNILGGVLSVTSDANLGTGALAIGNNAELLTTGASFVSGKAITLLGTGGGTLASASGLTATYEGVIGGTGPLNIGDEIAPGTIILNGLNTYSGGTTINHATLQIAADANLGAAAGGLTFNNGILQTTASFSSARAITLNGAGGTFDPSVATTLTEDGSITGAGGLTKIGAGTLTLSGQNTFSGGTLINAGTLVVDSAQALGLGNVVLQGGVLKSNSQPIEVAGNYVQNAGGTLQLTLGGSAPGQYDMLNVGGRAALNGTLQLLFLQSFQPKIGDKLTLVLAAGGVSGQFASALNPFNSLIGLELVYQPNSVVLEFPSNFTAFARTPNQQVVAAQLDAVAFDPREAPLLAFLQNQPLGNLGADFEQLSPDSLSALYEISFSGANIQAANLENRFAEIRNGSTGFTSSLHLSNSPGTMVEGKDGKAVIEPSQNLLAPSPENKWGVWTSGSGDFVNVSSDGNGQGYDFTTGGVSLGLDYRLTKNIAVGIAAGYAHTWTNLTENGNIDVNSARGGLYAAFSEDGFYLNGYAGGGYNAYYTRRNVLGGGASGSTNGGEFDGYAGGGYDFHCGGFAFGPIASLQYTYVGISGYNESGSLAPLRIVSQNQDSLRTNVGLSALYTWKAGWVQLRPSVRASWQHEYFYSALPIEAQFASGAGSIFTVHGPAEGHDSALINAGLDVQWTSTIGTYVGYDGQVGRTNYDSHAVIGSVHLDF